MENFPKNNEATDGTDYAGIRPTDEFAVSGETSQLDATYRKIGTLAKGGIDEHSEALESMDLANVSDTYKELAKKELDALGKLGSYKDIKTFEELEAATGIASVLRVGIAELGGKNNAENGKVLEAIIARDPSPETVTRLEQFIDRYEGNEQFMIRDVLPKMHQEWIDAHENDFADLAKNESTMQRCVQFLPFDRLGNKLMQKYADLAKTFARVDEDALTTQYEDYIEDQNAYDDDYNLASFDHAAPGVYSENVRKIFENETEILCTDASELYSIDGVATEVPAEIQNTLWGNRKLAKEMVYHYTFGEASPWTEDDKREAILSMVD